MRSDNKMRNNNNLSNILIEVWLSNDDVISVVEKQNFKDTFEFGLSLKYIEYEI